MAIDFPSTTGQATDGSFTHTSGGITWSWDGSTWTATSPLTENDPVYSASAAANVTSTKITNWDTAYGWGDHSTGGYLTSYTESDTLSDVVARGNTTTSSINLNGDGANGTKLAIGGITSSATRKLLIHTTSGHSNIVTEGSTGTGGDINIQAQNDVNIVAATDLELFAGGSNPATNKLVTLSSAGAVALRYQSDLALVTDSQGCEIYDQLQISGTSPLLKINNASSTGFVSFSYNLVGNAQYQLTGLPTTNGEVLTCNTSGQMSWSASAGGSSLQNRTTAAATTSSIGNNTPTYLDINNVAKTYALHRIETSAAAWVTLYTDSTSRTNDASRSEYTDPAPGSGVIAEIISSGGLVQPITPGVIGWNADGTPSETVYAKVVNKSGSTAAITVTLYFVKLED